MLVDRIYRRQRANHSADVHNPAAFNGDSVARTPTLNLVAADYI